MSIGHDKINILQCGEAICWCRTERPEESWLTNEERLTRCRCPATTYIPNFWDRACLVSFLNARGETRALHPKQTLYSKFTLWNAGASFESLRLEERQLSLAETWKNQPDMTSHKCEQYQWQTAVRCWRLFISVAGVKGRTLFWGKIRVKDRAMRITSSRTKWTSYISS